MHALVTSMPIRRLVTEQLPMLTAALLVAERFYKFHSFTLECAAFLCTWFVFDFIVQTLRRAFDQRA